MIMRFILHNFRHTSDSGLAFGWLSTGEKFARSDHQIVVVETVLWRFAFMLRAFVWRNSGDVAIEKPPPESSPCQFQRFPKGTPSGSPIGFDRRS